MEILETQQHGTADENKPIRYILEGNVLRFEDVLDADAGGPPMHIHPEQTETFRVISGKMFIVLSDREQELREGEQIEILPNQPHTFHTHNCPKTQIEVSFDPAGEMQAFFMGLERVKRKKLHPLLQIAVQYRAAKAFGFYMTGQPIWLQKLMFSVVGLYAYLRGYRAE
ncbi:cupin domain-containing protein [Amylibacter sp. SFDW26]|uniref:cupin domain-containing protein n=1 Tax=Amylibacter sp. SFDW26 TaxID=2652722 RepID=UPI001261B7F0|nr:cupin domain-containing protein [Amylibacter sp. SFDW26]KAB7613763.1 cupin domain-containing protein [Amylibacter sp. SFDW26]